MKLSNQQIQILYSIKDNISSTFNIEDQDILFLKNEGYIYCTPIPALRTERDFALNIFPAPTKVNCSLLDKAINLLNMIEIQQREEQRHLESISEAKRGNKINEKGVKQGSFANILSFIAIIIAIVSLIVTLTH